MSGSVVAVTGATGFVGSHLVSLLASHGRKVRAVVRRSQVQLPSGIEVRKADLLDPSSLPTALEGAEAAYYLVHSMEGRRDSKFAERDRQAAENFRGAAERAGVRRILYLGGLGEARPGISEHLRSRAEVGRILSSGSVPTTTLRAAIILGPGGASWEMLHQLVERLPVMVTPRWLETRCQPIALRDALGYLAGCLDAQKTAGGSFDIGGPDIMTYREMMHVLADIIGKRRYIIPIPVLTPRLSSYWVDFVTDVPAALASPLIEGLKNEVICRENRIRDLVPIPLTPYKEAVTMALARKV